MGEASGALGRLRDGCGDRSEFGPVARDEGERGRSGPRWVTGPRGAGQAGESGPGFWGKGWKAGYCYGFPFSILILKQTHKLEFKCEFEFKPQSLN